MKVPLATARRLRVS